VHDVKRIAGLPHVKARQGAPCAADRIKRAVLPIVQHVEVLEGLLDEFFGLFQRLAGDVLQGQAAQWQCHAAAHARAMNINKLK